MLNAFEDQARANGSTRLSLDVSAKVTKRLARHPNLVETLTLLSDSNGRPALVMRYYDGQTLENLLEHNRRLGQLFDLVEAFVITGKLASALAALHAVGTIHRDVKPANIVLANGEPILMDLGVVRTTKFPEQTTANAFMGTIRYSAPEYLFGDEHDASLDLFSLGAVVWELLGNTQYLAEETNWARMIDGTRKQTRK